MQFEGSVAESLQTITAIVPGSKWSCLLLRIVLRDALSEVAKNYPPLKLRVFVVDITALLMGENREVAEMAKKVMKKLKEEVERKGLKLAVTANGKEGKARSERHVVSWRMSCVKTAGKKRWQCPTAWKFWSST